jgi:hypothetical protein
LLFFNFLPYIWTNQTAPVNQIGQNPPVDTGKIKNAIYHNLKNWHFNGHDGPDGLFTLPQKSM